MTKVVTGSQKQPESARSRLYEVDRVTGLAIALVVIGHVVSREAPVGAEWYASLKYLIYKFHMPLFMFLSGLIFLHTYSPPATTSAFFSWLRKKAIRLVPGFFIVGLAILFGKIIASYVLHVDNVQADIPTALYRLMFFPASSAAGSLWYIYVLMELYVLVPCLLIVLGYRLWAVVAVTTVLHILHLTLDIPQLFMIDRVAEYALYFALGCIAAVHYEKLLHIVRRYGLVFLAFFALCFIAVGIAGEEESKLLIGLASIPAMFYLVGQRLSVLRTPLEFLASYTFTIYLLNTIVIGILKGMMLKFMPWDGAKFVIYFAVLSLGGTLIPILLYQHVLSRFRPLAIIFR